MCRICVKRACSSFWLFRVSRGDGIGMPSLRRQTRKSDIPMPDFPPNPKEPMFLSRCCTCKNGIGVGCLIVAARLLSGFAAESLFSVTLDDPGSSWAVTAWA